MRSPGRFVPFAESFPRKRSSSVVPYVEGSMGLHAILSLKFHFSLRLIFYDCSSSFECESNDLETLKES